MKRGMMTLLVLTLSLIVMLVACSGSRLTACGACNLGCAACTACAAVNCASSCLGAFADSVDAAYETVSSSVTEH